MAHYSTHCRQCPPRRADHVYQSAYITATVRATTHALAAGHTVEVWETDLLTLTPLLIETVNERRTSNQRRIPLDKPPY